MTLEEAKKALKDYITDEGLVWSRDKCLEYLNYHNGNTSATLDGDFDADELEAIAVFIRNES